MRIGIRSLWILALAAALAAPFMTAQVQPQPPRIDWIKGPAMGDLGGRAQIKVPDGFLFTGKKGAQKLLELSHNLPSGNEVGALVPAAEDQEWWVVFEFHEIGYVKDEEKDKLDAAKLLQGITEGTEEANKERQSRGWPAFHVVGWEEPPFYDPRTHNLTWAIRGKSDSGQQSINHSVRILGRQGTMNADLVMGAEQYQQALPWFVSLMDGMSFREGHRYADFVKGDKVATYGLAALIAGGAGAVALKTGLLAKSWKFLVALVVGMKKLLIVVIIGIGAAIKRAITWVQTRNESRAG